MLKAIYRAAIASTVSLTLLLSPMTSFAQVSPDGENNFATSEEDMLISINMIAIGDIISHLYIYEPQPTADMDIAMAGGEAYMAAEAISTGEFKALEAKLKLRVAKISEGKQSESLTFLKNSYDDSLSVLEKKLMLQKFAADSFAAAAITAYKMKENEVPAADYDMIVGKTAPMTTGTGRVLEKLLGLASSSATAAGVEDEIAPKRGEAPKIGEYNGTEYAECKKASDKISLSGAKENKCDLGMVEGASLQGKVSVLNRYLDAIIAARAAVAPSEKNKTLSETALKKFKEAVDDVTAKKKSVINQSPECVAYFSPMVNACNAFTKLLVNNEVHRPTQDILRGLLSHSDIRKKSHSRPSFFEWIIPTAEAFSFLDMTSMLDILGPNLLIMKQVTPEIAMEIDKYMFAPANRASLWKSLTGRANKAANATQVESDKIEINIEGVDKVIKGMPTTFIDNHSLFENIFNVLLPTVIAETRNASPTLTATSFGAGLRMPCASGPGNKNCPSLTTRIQSAIGFRNLPSTFKTLITQITRVSDDLSGANTISVKTMNNVNIVTSKHAVTVALLDKFHHSDPQMQNNIFNKFNRITASVLQKNGTTPAKFYASYKSTSSIKTDTSSVPVPAAINKQLPAIKTPIAAVAQPPIVAFAVAEGNQAGKEKKYKLNDINSDKKESIFTTISNRYLKSAFPKLFDK